jgi:hypothetical protein
MTVSFSYGKNTFLMVMGYGLLVIEGYWLES